ncbi:MAG: DNA repair exonuclease [Nanoarchaeota archaeon]
MPLRFAHMGDCHLGGWRYPEIRELNMLSFSKALEIIIKDRLDMVLITGDLFDSAYPPIEILKQAFGEFKKLKDANIPCFIIAGSHDYSVSGKTFLEVLEHAGFCVNVFKSEERDEKIILQPTIFKNYALFGYPGKKSSLEIEDLRRVTLNETPGFFKIFLLHTALREAIGNLPMDAISLSELPKADYYALGHLHVDFTRKDAAYSGPIFPNNFEELEELSHGQFQIVEINELNEIKRTKILLKLKDVLKMEIKIENTSTATERIISELNKSNITDKIVLLRLFGKLNQGKISDIKFNEIEKFAQGKKVYSLLRNISRLKIEESEIQLEVKDMHDIEENVIKDYLSKSSEKSLKRFEQKIPDLMKFLNIEKQEDEKNQIFSDRLLSEMKKVLNFNM